MTPDPITSEALASLTEGAVWALFWLAVVLAIFL